jgi:hypothetical protein
MNTDISTRLLTTAYTAADVLTKVNSLTGATQAGGLNADTMTFASGARSASSANTANTIVARDASGNFTAGTITATSFSGTHSGTAAFTSGTLAGITSLGASGVAITGGTAVTRTASTTSNWVSTGIILIGNPSSELRCERIL